MSHPDLELLGVMGLADADRLGYMMKDKGVTIEKLFNKATCSSGSCGASVEVWYYKEDNSFTETLKNTENFNFPPSWMDIESCMI